MGQTATDYARDRISNLRLLSDLVQETGFDGTDYLPVPRMDVSQSRYFRPKKRMLVATCKKEIGRICRTPDGDTFFRPFHVLFRPSWHGNIRRSELALMLSKIG